MKKRILSSVSTIGIAVAVGIAAPARAADAPLDYNSWYVSIFGGYADGFGHSKIDNEVINFDLDGGFVLGGAVGRRFAPDWRIETELSYFSNGFDTGREAGSGTPEPISGEVQSLLLTGNIWRDFRFGRFNPYVGGGLGSGMVKAHGEAYAVSGAASWSDTSAAFTGQLGAGVRIPVTDRFLLDLGYRFRGIYTAGMEATGDFGGTPDENGSFTQFVHSVQVGGVYSFGNEPVPTAAPGDGNWYASLFGGLAVPEDTAVLAESPVALRHSNGASFGGAVGVRITPRLRAEGELSFLSKDTNDSGNNDAEIDPASGKLKQYYLMANLWHDIPMGSFSPYFGGGLGFGFVDGGSVVSDGDQLGGDTTVGLAAQVGAGVRAQFTDNLAADIGYRFKSILEANIGALNGTGDFWPLTTKDHVVQLGLTYGFNASPIVQDDGGLGGTYVSLFGGAVMPVSNHLAVSSDYYARYKTGFTVGAAIGRQVADNIRSELELSYVNYKVKDSQEQDFAYEPESGDVSTLYAMGNLWRDWQLGPFDTYGGFGVGLAFTHSNFTLDGGNITFDDKTTDLAVQVGSGVRYAVTDNALIDVGYRLKATTGILANSDSDYGYSHQIQHVVQAGLTWKF